MGRGLAYKRNQRNKHIKRKEDILRTKRTDNPPHYYNDSEVWKAVIDDDTNKIYIIDKKGCIYSRYMGTGDWYPHHIVKSSGYLNKGKIHCSCPLCRAKVRETGFKPSDLKKIDQMNWDENFYNKNYTEELKYTIIYNIPFEHSYDII